MKEKEEYRGKHQTGKRGESLNENSMHNREKG